MQFSTWCMMRTSVQNDATNKLNSNQLILLVLSLLSSFLLSILYLLLAVLFWTFFVCMYILSSHIFSPKDIQYRVRNILHLGLFLSGIECVPYKYIFYYKHICSMFNFYILACIFVVVVAVVAFFSISHDFVNFHSLLFKGRYYILACSV